eukprot:GHVU01084332.1.p2 GENE.GHVU01084332.1~~GHVU01084332.1.p2  ORF type:complete len:163 (+),score=26.16 GHVU01084332.1:29-490(+)
MSYDGCTKDIYSVMGIRVRVPTDAGVQSFLAMVAPHHDEGSDGTFDFLTNVMTTLDPEFYKKLFGVCFDGCPVNTGEDTGANKQLRDSITGPLLFIWCAIHQLQLITGEVVDGLDFAGEEGDRRFQDVVVTVRQIRLPKEMGKCPELNARWYE